MDKKKLFVGNLSYDVTNDDLQAAFAAAGSVTSAQVVTDRDTGRSRGFGFVEMSTDEEAENAVSMLHEKEFKGRTMLVNVARPKGDAPRRSGGGGGAGGARGGYRGGGNSRY